MSQHASLPFSLTYYHPDQKSETAPCMAACPAGGQAREWIALVAQREKLGLTKEAAFRRAWNLFTDVNPFPAITGRICPHPCESECNRIPHDGAVSVNQLERFLGDWALEQNLDLLRVPFEKQRGRVAVIGAGPAGLSFAYHMRRRGHEVDVFEAKPDAGGMLRYGIPSYRLPKDILQAEINRLVRFGVRIHVNQRIGVDVSLETLRRDFDLVFVGVGAQAGKRLGLDGEDDGGVYPGVDYLFACNTGQPPTLGKKVLVVGGGNTAVDAARMARRQGADVTLLYRRTRAEMPAIDHEVDQAIEEGVLFEYLASPISLERVAGQLRGVKVQGMRLGPPDGSGRRRPEPVEGDVRVIEADAVITAVSQEPDWSDLEALLSPVKDRSDPDVFDGGDVHSLGLASAAIGAGRVAAEQAHERIQGRKVDRGARKGPGVRVPDIRFAFYEPLPRVSPPVKEADQRLAMPQEEVQATITEEQFLKEASRCLSCQSCFGCKSCWMYCNAGGFTEKGNPRPGEYFDLDLSVCEGCGKCIEVCPCGFLQPTT